MNFRKLGSFEASPLVEELRRATFFWGWLNLRKADGLPHTHVDDIALRFQSVQGATRVEDFFERHECVDYFPQLYFPRIMQLARRVAEGRKMGRVVLAKLRPYGRIEPHVDEGGYCAAFDRIHCVLTTNPNVIFSSGGELQHLRAGEIWQLNNKNTHSVTNAGNTERVHLIVDAGASET